MGGRSMSTGWSWAELDDRQVERVRETEATLDADFVLVYRESGTGPGQAEHRADELGVRPSDLSAPEVDRVRALEREVDGVAVAYERTT